MLTINVLTIFAFGLVITAIVFKGMLQAEEFRRQGQELQSKKGLEHKEKIQEAMDFDTYEIVQIIRQKGIIE